jgi:multidrug efflux pump subunit AcrA (membrane-fusion protein)
MSNRKQSIQRALSFFGLTALGVGAYLWLKSAGEQPSARPKRERGQPVRVIVVNATAAVPRVTGYGEVAAARSWQGVAEVGGTIIEVHPDVQVGRIVREGTLLFEIDPEALELEKLITEASAKGVRAQISELSAREASARATLGVEQKVLDLANREVERTQSLYQQGSASQSEVEAAQASALSAEKAVIALRNTLAELPASRRILAAQLEQVNAGVTGAQMTLARTKIVAPFTMRISQLNVTTGQSVSGAAVLIVGESLDVLEVTARLPIGGIDPLLPERPERRDPEPEPEPAAPTEPVEPAEAVEPSEPAPPPTPRVGWFDRVAEVITPTVRLRLAGVDAAWPAEFSRFAGVDPLTRTTGVVVRLDRSQRRAGSRDVRLSSGMHVSVDFVGAAKPGCLAVPIGAIHDGVAYVATAEDRLEVRALEIDWAQEEFACISAGLVAGDRVIVSEVAPAVDGMRVVPSVDAFETTRLAGLVGATPEAS